MAESKLGALTVWRILSAALLVVIGGIHLFLVVSGTGGILGVMFVLNGIAGIVLAIAILVLRGRLQLAATVFGLLFAIASLAALLLALTVSLFGITETWDYMLVPQTVVIDAVAVVVLGITTVLTLRRPR
jgi:energy-coupling factor transporter transmembrane protein EcfT